MTVRELIEALQKMPADLTVVIPAFNQSEYVNVHAIFVEDEVAEPERDYFAEPIPKWIRAVVIL